MNFPIPVIDLFAGPGGLSEGFAALDKKEGTPFFSICLSIEKEENAYQTLLLRSFFRQFPFNKAPNLYYNLLSDTERPLNERLQELYHNFPQKFENAIQCTLKAELGKDDKQSINERIKKAIGSIPFF
ncbi:MAG: hypothetical protein NT106_07050 [Candidatus Sumerlaeota bacterium]|nr:hypothetical protein [Candidatus Sumerlaeota bacterium]